MAHLADAQGIARETSWPLGALLPSGQLATRRFALPGTHHAHTPGIAWIFSCPSQAGQLVLESVQMRVAAPESATPSGRATWIWNPNDWLPTPGLLLDQARVHHLHTLFMTVPIDDQQGILRSVLQLRAFIQSVHHRGISVWAVEGAPDAIRPQNQEIYARHAAIFTAYNRQAPGDARLDGLQYDIEPYLIPGYRIAADYWLRAYLRTIRKIRAQTPLPVEMAVPFWWAGQHVDGAPLLDKLVPLVDGLTVMDYRTAPDEIQQFARPYLDWGARYDRKVRIALEAGPLNYAVRRNYRPAGKGELWLTKVGDWHVLLLLSQAAANPDGSSFQFTHQSITKAGTTTFHDQWPALQAVLPPLERAWSKSPAFNGIAIHPLLVR